MDIVHLFFGFNGRVSRQPFWIGLLILAAAEVIAMLALGVPFIPSEMNPFPVRVTEFAIQLVTLYPTVAIAVKRLHDRNQSGKYAAWLVGLVLIILVTNLWGLTGDPKNATWLDWILGFCAVVVGLAFLIELGFRRGTAGTNQFGPDPLDGRAARGDGSQ